MILKLSIDATILNRFLVFSTGVHPIWPLFCLILQSKFSISVHFHDLCAFCVDIKYEQNIFHKICGLVLDVWTPRFATSNGTYQAKIEVYWKPCTEISLFLKLGDSARNFLTHNWNFFLYDHLNFGFFYVLVAKTNIFQGSYLGMKLCLNMWERCSLVSEVAFCVSPRSIAFELTKLRLHEFW